jgi:hypothetical protein
MPSSFNQLSNEDRNKLLSFIRYRSSQRNISRTVVRPNWRRQRIPLGNGQASRRIGCNCGK